MSSKTPNIPLPNPASHSSTMPPSSDALPLTLPDTTQKSQPGMADAAAEADTPTICGLSTPPTSPPIHSLGSSRSKPCAVQAPPAAEGQLQPHAAMPLPPIGPDRRQRYATHDHPILTSTYTSSSSTSSSSSGSVDRAVRALMAELDASIFRNVSSAVSAYFLDINDVGHFVSMPHIGACASPEANHVMRLIEETLTRNAGYLLDPTDRAGLEAFGDALARRVSLGMCIQCAPFKFVRSHG
ncbi:hypothetical protein BCR44DRAFT_1238717 [Catenaria anguillulae PL171]|uniref:Uncharacterized protein n=1 Tax=Catenaria anguillulae PL171 TaxID=765915 RepID=A0A1Y2HFJ2_9FUNG|nr:hypothetical protein BCR44DRAFT_1238717 [Catenaria anguillulae PL171]